MDGLFPAPLLGSIKQGLDIGLPLLLVHSRHIAVIGHEPVDLALNIGGLSPDTATAGVALHLVLQLAEQEVAAVVPSVVGSVDFVSFVDAVDGFLHVPEAGNAVNGIPVL